MPNKALRIMIADTQHAHRMRLEFLFNQQGYFRIVPVSDVQELMTLVEYASEPFDLLVVDACLADGADLPGFFLEHPQLRHGMIYNARQAGPMSVPGERRTSVYLHPAPLPDLVSLANLMARIDPQDNVSAAPWDRAIRQGLGG
ncbi:ANTAR domain-containing protein [Pseudomonas uvaldensis]|uniref:response regulator n=1 Tax=Pseudomonas uvaldensis TaxID=2878385 RepID=UPI001E54585D|nr:response regulator [Pseudomonas uvaldensis]MCE0464300.1 response regulator [Pseudomonas uvaldensis]